MGNLKLSVASTFGALALAGAAFAGPVLPGFDFTVSVDGVDSGFVEPGGSDLGGGLYEWAGTHDNGDWNFGQGYNVTVNTGEDRISLAFGFQNNTLETHTYVVYAVAPVMTFGSGSTMVATVAATLNDINGDGASMSNPLGVAGFSGEVDGVSVVSLLDPYSLTAPVDGGDSTNDSTGGLIAGPAALTSDMAIAISFELSPGDIASFTSSFRLFPVPAPGALAVFGLAALGGRRRRRG